MEKKKKLFTIKDTFLVAVLVPGIILAVLLVLSIVFSILYALKENIVYLILLFSFIGVFSIMYTVVCARLVRNLKKLYVEGLYQTTTNVLKELVENSPNIDLYPETDIKELNELNNNLLVIKSQFENATVISNDLNTANIPLEHINDDPLVVTLKSFKQYLPSLIYSAQNFRNAIIEIFYDFDKDSLTDEEETRILEVIKKTFNSFQHPLFIPSDDKSGFYVFLPYINSFSRINELLVNMTREISVSKKTYDGLVTVNARYSIVCYPYSNISELFTDLRYAKRQGQLINLYLPNRLSALNETLTLQNSVNLNNVSRIMEVLSALKISSREKQHSLNTIKKTFDNLNEYLGIDHSGIFIFDDNISKYVSYVSTSKGAPLFKEGFEVDKEFIDILDTVKDPDNSYYFSSREHSNVALSKYIDRLNVESGFYYLIHDHEKVFAAIYFFKCSSNFVIDSYIREALFLLSYRIGDYLLLAYREDTFNDTYREINNLLMTSDYSLYRIDQKDYSLVSFSQHFKTLFKNAKIGEKCYKAMYGLDSPCKDCPLFTSKKKHAEVDGTKYEVSLTLNETKTDLKRLLVHTIKDEVGNDRFDKDLLINSYSSLGISLNNLYTINARGYLLVLRIDNISELVNELGSENYLYILRQFINRVKNIGKSKENIYYFDPQGISILLPETGQIDVVNIVEKIYEVSKQNYMIDDKIYHFNVTYLPYSFPQNYPTAPDFLKHALRHYNQANYDINKDLLIFPDGDYSRSASRNEFMLAVINEQFGNKTFSVALQPMVRASDKSIVGAELFIRLSDNYRNMVFSADELIKVAAKNGKISLISNALIKYIGELYQQFGLTVFKIFGFSRLTINTDFSYFNDPNFFNDIYELLVSYHLPRDFLGFEITEKEIYNHLEEFRGIAKGILNQHIVLICDQYSGSHLSIDKLKELGFSEIKIGRNLVGDIETNPKHLSEVTLLMEEARNQDVKVSLVGVENADQFTILRDIDKRCYLQGYHFYKPLDKIRFIEELRKNN